jgi:hypothetical protein
MREALHENLFPCAARPALLAFGEHPTRAVPDCPRGGVIVRSWIDIHSLTLPCHAGNQTRREPCRA